METSAAIQLALAMLPLIKTGVTEFIAWLASMRKAMKQTGEWTPELEAQYRAALWAKTQWPKYRPDPA